MKENLHTRVTTVETRIGHIEKDIKEVKRSTNMNTQEIKKTNDILNKMHVNQTEFLSLAKGAFTAFSYLWKITKIIFLIVSASGLGLAIFEYIKSVGV